MKNLFISNAEIKPKKTIRNVMIFSIVCMVIMGILLIFFSPKNANIDYSESEFIQFEEPSDDVPVVVFETTEGTIKAVLYEDEAPEYCKYFKGLVNDGYYDDTYVCANLKSGDVSGGFVAGTKTVDGSPDENTNNEKFDLEISKNLLSTKGAIGSFVDKGGLFKGPKSGNFFTVFGDNVNIEELESIDSDKNGYNKICEYFEKYGGIPNFMQGYTIFAQIYDGWDTYAKILKSRIVDEDVADGTKGKSYQLEDEIKLTKVYISTYGENKENGYTIPSRGSY